MAGLFEACVAEWNKQWAGQTYKYVESNATSQQYPSLIFNDPNDPVDYTLYYNPTTNTGGLVTWLSQNIMNTTLLQLTIDAMNTNDNYPPDSTWQGGVQWILPSPAMHLQVDNPDAPGNIAKIVHGFKDVPDAYPNGPNEPVYRQWVILVREEQPSAPRGVAATTEPPSPAGDDN